MANEQNSKLRTTLKLVRSLFPRWDFFDELGYQATLEIARSGTSKWKGVPSLGARSSRLGSLFVNPFGNLLHAKQSLIDQFTAELQDFAKVGEAIEPAMIKNLSTYQLVANFAHEEARMAQLQPSFQFRIVALTPGEVTEVFVSEPMKVALTAENSP